MTVYNPSKQTWLNPNIEYLFNQEIIEYDMQDAGFSIIKQFHLLPDAEIRRLNGLEKGIQRHTAIGILQRDDRTFSKALSDKFAEVRMIFLESNHVENMDILSVKKDAIFTTRACSRLRFGAVRFIPKHQYSSYIRLREINNMELYYNEEGIDIKGMSDSSINRHRLYLIEFLRRIIGYIESQNSYGRRYLMKFVMDYKSHVLPEEYYLEFNNASRAFNPLYNYQRLVVPIVQMMQQELCA